LGANKDRISKYFNDRKAQSIYNGMLAEKNALEEKKKNDFAGGKTPEETISLVISSLINKDVTIANGYFSLDSEKGGWINSNNIDITLENLKAIQTNGVKKCVDSTKQCTFSYTNNTGRYIMLLEQNVYTKVWKIIY
jgi:hypothetical protein